MFGSSVVQSIRDGISGAFAEIGFFEVDSHEEAMFAWVTFRRNEQRIRINSETRDQEIFLQVWNQGSERGYGPGLNSLLRFGVVSESDFKLLSKKPRSLQGKHLIDWLKQNHERLVNLAMRLHANRPSEFAAAVDRLVPMKEYAAQCVTAPGIEGYVLSTMSAWAQVVWQGDRLAVTGWKQTSKLSLRELDLAALLSEYSGDCGVEIVPPPEPISGTEAISYLETYRSEFRELFRRMGFQDYERSGES